MKQNRLKSTICVQSRLFKPAGFHLGNPGHRGLAQLLGSIIETAKNPFQSSMSCHTNLMV